MDSSELLKRVKRIEIKTRHLSNHVFAGEYHSAFKGRGMSFAEVREYQLGDDVRDIDWNVTARTSRPHIKVFEEERELTVMLLVDVSKSLDFGTVECTQRELIAEIAATIAFSSLNNNDKIGMVMFSDVVEKYIPPQKGKKHVLHIVRELLSFEPQHKRTDINVGIEFLMRTQRKRSIGFLLSDFVASPDFANPLAIAARKHDIVGVKVYDPRMVELPNVGLMKVEDAETGEAMYVDTASRSLRDVYSRWWLQEEARLDSDFRKCGVDYATIATTDDFVAPLQALFERRRV
ncbi:MAG: DUF58 domain-containing protein [Bacteroidaceae bacterium]|nr:DUF58 domain-containing protein [Bacteroidaceae bacterium]